uniref:C2H2-type domain-containing protein n=1 Tax=Glossina austeni TaxID=7395 RepID=A0A1A9VQD9_GLOAU
METKLRGRLRQASSMVMPPLPEQQVVPERSCDICGSVFSSLAQLRQHARRGSCRGNLAGVDNVCHLCDRNFETYVCLRQHERLANPVQYNQKMAGEAATKSKKWTADEQQELAESLSLNEEDATLRREILASHEKGKDALAEWVNRLTGCISRIHRNPTLHTVNRTALRSTNRTRRARMYRRAQNVFEKNPKKLADLILENGNWYELSPPNMTAVNEFCRIFAEPSINDDEPIADQREESINVMQAISAELRWAMKSMKSDTSALDNITLNSTRRIQGAKEDGREKKFVQYIAQYLSETTTAMGTDFGEAVNAGPSSRQEVEVWLSRQSWLGSRADKL